MTEHQDERDRLPVMKWLVYDHDGQTTDVMLLLGQHWPEVQVKLVPRGQGIAMSGTFRPDSALRLVELEADDDAEITTAQIRPSALVVALKEWNAVAREMAEQILENRPAEEVSFYPKAATDALRRLTYQAPRKRTVRKRGTDAEQLIQEVVDAYREALVSGDPSPRKTLAERFSYSNEHIGRLLTQARRSRNGRPPLLGPARAGKAGEVGERSHE